MMSENKMIQHVQERVKNNSRESLRQYFKYFAKLKSFLSTDGL